MATLFPCARVRAMVLAASNFKVAEFPAPISVSAGARIEETLDVDAGELTLVLPQDLSVPPNATGLVSLYLGGLGRQTLRLTLRRPTEHTEKVRGMQEWTGSEVDLGLVPAGKYQVKVRILVGNQFPTTLRGEVEVHRLQRSICRVEPGAPDEQLPR